MNLELGFFSVLVSRLRAAAGALFPPKGEEKKCEVEAERHARQEYQYPARAIGREQPALRHEPGAISEWMAAWRKRRGRGARHAA